VPVHLNGPSGNVLKSHRKHNAIELECGMVNTEMEVVCSSCNIVLPSGICNNCSALYCGVCYKSYHKNQDYPEYSTHTLEVLNESVQNVVDEIIKKRDEERYSHL
jgi:hypothetical protein